MVSDTTAAEIERRRLEEAEAESAEIDRTPVRSYWQLVRQRFLKHRLAVFARHHADRPRRLRDHRARP